MTRINDRLLVQRVDNAIVILDESAGAEIAFDVQHAPALIRSMAYLAIGLDPLLDGPAARQAERR